MFLLCFAVSPAQAQLASGDVLAGVGAGKIKQFTPAGSLKGTLDTGTTSSETTGMCFDQSTNLFSTLFTISQVAKFNSAGTLVTSSFGTGYNADPESCVFDAAGNIFVGQADGTTVVKKFNAGGTLITDFAPDTSAGRGTDFIDLAADQCTLHYTGETSVIKQFNVCTNTQLADFVTGLPGGSCYAHRIRNNGEELVACSSVVNRVSSAGVVLQTYTNGSFSPAPGQLFALNLDPDGTTFWTGDISSGQVYRMNIATGVQVTSWNAGILGSSMAGLAVVGEIQVGQPTPTPTGNGPTRTPTQQGGVATGIPTLSPSMLGLLCLALVAAAFLLMRK